MPESRYNGFAKPRDEKIKKWQESFDNEKQRKRILHMVNASYGSNCLYNSADMRGGEREKRLSN